MKSYGGSKKAKEKKKEKMKKKKKKVLQNPNPPKPEGPPKLDEEKKAHAGSKKVVLQNPPVPFMFQFSVKPERGRVFKPWTGKMKKVTVRFDKESIDDYFPEFPVPELDLPFPSLDLQYMEMQESFVARQRAQREERDSILKQLEDFGYADVEFEVPDHEG